MLASKNNHLFISASISLILIAFFIVIGRQRSDVLSTPLQAPIQKISSACAEVLKNGLSLQVKNTENAINAMGSENTKLEDIIEPNSILALKNATKCLGRSPLEINIDSFSKEISTENDPLAKLKITDKISNVLEQSLGTNKTFKNINVKIITNIKLARNDH